MGEDVDTPFEVAYLSSVAGGRLVSAFSQVASVLRFEIEGQGRHTEGVLNLGS
jgi:hypothetical protein